MQDHIAIILNCYHNCLATLKHCLKMRGVHSDAPHINLLLDCIRICELNAEFISRHSEFNQSTTMLCADICDRCAQSCEGIDSDDEVMKNCAVSCRNCAAICRSL